jgi:tetratricopeptide (TPR) repeat protein
MNAPVIIGRDHPAAVLRAETARVADSHGGLVLVTGEAGIGKTTLVTGVADEARRRGALVLSGACWDSDSAPGYWPWVQVIRGLRRAATAREWAQAEEAGGHGLSVVLGEARGAKAAEGFELFDSVTTALVSVSQSRPVVVVLDDLHWADAASLKLLEFAAQHTWFERLLLVGTYRDVEVESTAHPLRPLLTPLLARATTVTLTGLDRAEVGALMARTAGREPDPDLVAEVHRRTGGNPFFVEQTARLWRSGGAVTAIAPGVRDAVQRRLSLLPEPVVRLLADAAVLGREFHRQVLALLAAAPVPQVDRLLDHALTARLVVTLGAGRFGFAHDLVRETLYDGLGEEEARRRHAAAVRALDGSPALAARVLAADLARHAYLAGDDLEPDRAVDHLLAAARDADSRMASEETLGHYRRAYERGRGGNPRRLVTIALDLAGQLRHTEDDDAAGPVYDEAVALARRIDAPDLLARAALCRHRHDVPEDWADLVREAHRGLLGGDSAAPPDRLARELAERVVELARAGGDDEALVFGLWARHNAIWGMGTAAERAAITEELIATARRHGDTGSEYFAASFRWVALLELGDPGYLDQYARFVAMTDREGKPRAAFASHIDGSIITTLTGRFQEAEELLDKADRSHREHFHPHFAPMAAHLRWALLLAQGRFDELAKLDALLAETDHPQRQLLDGLAALQRGDVDTARARLADAPEPYPRDYAPMWLRLQAGVAAAVRDPKLCARARAALEPLRGQWLVSVYGCDVGGPAELWLALLDAAEERWQAAVEGLTAAHRSADRLRARPWSVEVRSHLAVALLARGGAGDAGAAGELFDEVEREAAEIGMRHVVARVRRTRSGVSPPAAPPALDGAEFRRDGATWSLGFAGRTIHMPDAKGLRDLHLLLSQPGTDIPSVRLLSPEGGEVVVAAGRMGGDPILDDEAKARYKRRLTLLDEEIDRLSERGDDGRAAELDRERDALLDELRAAAGLAGRDRRLGDETERARKTVTARIRDTLRKLDQTHPDLSSHLRASVSTGTTCRYDPPAQPPRWHL